ncbi:MAG: DUF3375 family protein, partial [Anaerolineae bacterium]|nr:DUF3375 family protein [Anaerolineae bacterium]
RRGYVLQTALDANDQLEASDEGQSFRAFYDLITHPHQRDHFEKLLHTIFNMPRLMPFMAENIILQRLTSYLLDAGERVNRSNQRLAEHLRRIVDTGNIAQSRRVQTLSGEIKHLVSKLDTTLLIHSSRTFYTIEGDPDVELPLERPLYVPTEQIISSERPRGASNLIDVDVLDMLYNTFYIDQTLLQDNIQRMLMSRPEVFLTEVVTSYPISQGIAEVIAYLLIATDAPHHLIDRTTQDTIAIKTYRGDEKELIVPRVLFRRMTKQMDVIHGG